MKIFNYGHKEIDYLKNKDNKLGFAIERIGMIERAVTPDLFTAIVESIISQQISSKAAATVIGRVKTLIGEITPESVAGTDAEEVQKCGLSMRKANYIKSLADAIVQGDVDLSALNKMTDQEVIKYLSRLNGIGAWTAEMLLIFSMERPDVVSYGDLAIQRGMIELYGLKTLSKEQFEKYRKRYSPYGSVASLYLWELSKA